MTTIETARTLLASASPELRRAVGKLIREALEIEQDRPDTRLLGYERYDRREAEFAEYWRYADELIEYKGGAENVTRYKCSQCGEGFDTASDNPNPSCSVDERSACPFCGSLEW